jgi:hypothetical protein
MKYFFTIKHIIFIVLILSILLILFRENIHITKEGYVCGGFPKNICTNYTKCKWSDRRGCYWK